MTTGLSSSSLPSRASSALELALNLSANEDGLSASSSLPSALPSALSGFAPKTCLPSSDRSSPESWRCFFTGGEGAEKLWVPEPTYDLKAFTGVAEPRRGGLLLRLRPKVDGGDLERDAAAKDDAEAANASNPLRFVPVGDVDRALGDLPLLLPAKGDVVAKTEEEGGLFALAIANGDDGFMPKADEKLDAFPLLVPARGDGEGVDF